MESETITDLDQINRENAHYITKVFGWMAIGLAISGLVSYLTNINCKIVSGIFSNMYVYWVMFGVQIGIVILLTTLVNRMKANVAVFSFLLYSIFTGFIFSSLFLVLTMGNSLTSTFFCISATFGVMYLIGHFTNKDLTKISQVLLMVIIGLIIATIINYSMDNDSLIWQTSLLGILLFSGVVVFNTKKIKEMNIIGNEGSDEDKKEAIMGALCLYIVF